MSPILTAVISVTAIGAICGILLTVASKVMYVYEDPRVSQLRDILPGANCGACGYAGCDGYAAALTQGGVETNLCVPGADTVSYNISQILGSEYKDVIEQVAAVRCGGSCEARGVKMDYDGLKSCAAAKMYYSGSGACTYGCMGFGDCAAVCPNGAICIKDGVARVKIELCGGCGQCAKICPNKLIWIHDDTISTLVICSSQEKGADVRKKCKSGCIACRKCERECPVSAVKIENNLAVIDYGACIGCGKCAEVCTTKCIKMAIFSRKNIYPAAPPPVGAEKV